MRTLCLVSTLTIGWLVAGPTAWATESSTATTGEVRLASGLRAHYDYHFDRNALAASLDLPGGLVALTRSGNLIRFDRQTFRPTQQWVGPSRATCLGSGENGQGLVGFEDGRVARLDPSTLALSFFARLPGPLQWVGWKRGKAAGIVVVVERWKWFVVTRDGLGQLGYPDLPPDDRLEVILRGSRTKTGRQEWMPYSEIHDLTSTKPCAIGGRAMSIFFDSKNRFWFGYERGEFSGWCRCVDVSGAQPFVVRDCFDPDNGDFPLRDNIYGFFEPRDGRIWAFGGLEDISIYRVDTAKLETLLEIEGFQFGEERKPVQPDQLGGIVTAMIEETKPGSFLAISEGGLLYRTDKALQRWVALRDLSDEIRSNLVDTATGDSYPAIRALHDRGGTLLIATASDGYVRIDKDGEFKKQMVPDQLEARIDGIEATSAGTFFRPEGEESPWQLKDGRWTHEPLVLPFEGPPENPQMFTGPDGSLYAISDAQIRRFKDGKVETVAQEFPGHAASYFVLPDGTLWAVGPVPQAENGPPMPILKAGGPGTRTSSGTLSRLIGGKWEKMVEFPGLKEDSYLVREYLDDGEMLFGSRPEIRKTRRADGAGYPFPPPAPAIEVIGSDLRVLNSTGPRWIIFDRVSRQLFCLDLSLPAPNFTLIPISEAGVPLKVYDAVGWSSEDVLIATRKGLKLVNITTGKVSPSPLPSPGRPVQRLVRDGLNRLWLGGEGLWMIDETNHLHDLAEVPMVGRSTIAALAPDPAHKDGVIVSLGVRGVAFLRVESTSGH